MILIKTNRLPSQNWKLWVNTKFWFFAISGILWGTITLCYLFIHISIVLLIAKTCAFDLSLYHNGSTQQSGECIYYMKVCWVKLQGVLFSVSFFLFFSFMLPFLTIVVHLNSFVTNAYYISNHKHLSDLFMMQFSRVQVNAPHTNSHKYPWYGGVLFHFPNNIKC